MTTRQLTPLQHASIVAALRRNGLPEWTKAVAAYCGKPAVYARRPDCATTQRVALANSNPWHNDPEQPPGPWPDGTRIWQVHSSPEIEKLFTRHRRSLMSYHPKPRVVKGADVCAAACRVAQTLARHGWQPALPETDEQCS